MNIANVKVYGLDESLVRMGYPMMTEIGDIEDVLWDEYDLPDDPPRLKRGKSLGNTPIGSGHDQGLTGIIVQFDLEAPSYLWPELQRYHFIDFISSQSKMHRITKFDLSKQCIEGTDSRIIAVTQEYIQKYNNEPTNENYENILKNTPMGLQLTAGLTTNYRQLKTVYAQRKDHRLSGWKSVICPWIESLPCFRELCLSGGNK